MNLCTQHILRHKQQSKGFQSQFVTFNPLFCFMLFFAKVPRTQREIISLLHTFEKHDKMLYSTTSLIIRWDISLVSLSVSTHQLQCLKGQGNEFYRCFYKNSLNRLPQYANAPLLSIDGRGASFISPPKRRKTYDYCTKTAD